MYEFIRPGYLDLFAKSGTWLDAIAIQGMPRMLGRARWPSNNKFRKEHQAGVFG